MDIVIGPCLNPRTSERNITSHTLLTIPVRWEKLILAIILAVILDFRRIGFSDVTDIVKFGLLDSDNIGKYILHSFHDNILRMI